MQVIDTNTGIQLADDTSTLPGQVYLTSLISSAKKTEVNPIFAYTWWKGVFDRVLALCLLITLSPVFVIIALAIMIDSRGGAVYRREQVGENGRFFKSYKFRTMQNNNNDGIYKSYLVKYILENAPYKIDDNGRAVYKVVDDPRVTKIGSLLRKTNLDELPQLVNVLKGEMSFVGPRPDIPFAVAMYKDWHKKRLNAKPGITGLWQVCNRKGVPFDGMVRLDIEYINRQSLFLDIKILFFTIGTVLRRDGS